MKRIVCLLLVILSVLGFCSCGTTDNTSKTISEWTVAEAASPDVFGEPEENSGLWIASPLAASQAYTDVAIMENTLSLKRGNYRFYAEISINDNVVANIENASSFLAGMIKVVNAKEAEAISIKELSISDFESSDRLQGFFVNFSIRERTSVKFEIAWFNTVVMKVGVCKVMSIPKSEHTVGDLETWIYSSSAGTLDTDKLYFFNLKEYLEPVELSREKYDISLLVSCLQGLVNRTKPLLYINFSEGNSFVEGKDLYWIEYLKQKGNILAGIECVEVKSLGELLTLFDDYYDGFVVWDESVPATSNVACTIAGTENLLPIRYSEKDQTLYDILSEKNNFTVKVDLNDKFKNGSSENIFETGVKSTGSAKNDAYLYAMENYMKTGKTNSHLMAYHVDAYTFDKTGESVSYYDLDNCMLANKDYYIKNKAFFWDLNVTDSIPNDDRTQSAGTDLSTLKKLLKTQNELADGSLIEVGGFVPWYIKYTSVAGYGNEGQPGAVDAEWRLAVILGEYYGVADADAYPFTSMANASVYSHVSLPQTIEQTNGQKSEWTDEQFFNYCKTNGYIDANGNVIANNYIMLYMGDYDSSAWMTTAMGNLFTDQNLGFVSMTFPVNFGPSNRIPFMYQYIFEKASENENVFFAGDHNGYGYLDLNTLAGDRKDLNGSLDSYFQLTSAYNERFDLGIQAFIINNSKVALTNAVIEQLCRAYPLGVVMDATKNVSYKLSDGMEVPWSKSISLSNGVLWDEAVETLKINFSGTQNVNFTQLRAVTLNPTFVRKIYDNAVKQGANMTVIDQYTYFWLLKYFNHKTNNVIELG